MFPGVDGFHWTAGHLIFLGVFFSVLGIIATTVVLACIRSARDAQAEKIEHIRWAGEFHDLPEEDRACRHQLTGKVKQRTCKFKFDCRACDTHPKYAAQPQPAAPSNGAAENVCGLEYPRNRMYHRGHSWAHVEDDGTVTVGLDELGECLIGDPEAVLLPAVGSRLEVSGPAWQFRKNGISIRILSPVEGEVLETGDPQESGWYLKVRPSDTRTTHLLQGPEVKNWIRREMDKLQVLMSDGAVGVTLADGGVLADNISETGPRGKWDRAVAAMFLES